MENIQIQFGKCLKKLRTERDISQEKFSLSINDEDTKTFVFSPRNHSEPNDMTNIIIEYMNQDFDRFNNAGTAGEKLEIDTNVFAGWIVEHYKDRNVKYFISHKNDYVILPIRKFAAYFDIVANYRIKKSGSSDPARKDFAIVKDAILQLYPSVSFIEEDGKLYATINTPKKRPLSIR